MANKTLGLLSGTKSSHSTVQRTKVRRNISPEFVRNSLEEPKSDFPKTEDVFPKTEKEPREEADASPLREREGDRPVFPKTPVSLSTLKKPALSYRRTSRNARGEEAKRFDIYLSGKDKKTFEELVERMSKMMPNGKKIKNNDVVRAMLPTFLRVVKYVDKSAMPGRPSYGSKEYRSFIDKLGELLWDATLTGIATEAQRYGLTEEEYHQLPASNG